MGIFLIGVEKIRYLMLFLWKGFYKILLFTKSIMEQLK